MGDGADVVGRGGEQAAGAEAELVAVVGQVAGEDAGVGGQGEVL